MLHAPPLVTIVWDANSVPSMASSPSRTISAALTAARTLTLRSRTLGVPCRYEAVWVTPTTLPQEDIINMHALQVAIVKCDHAEREGLAKAMAHATEHSSAIVLVSGDIRVVGCIKHADERGVEVVLINPDSSGNSHILAAYASRELSVYEFMQLSSTAPHMPNHNPMLQPIPSYPPLPINMSLPHYTGAQGKEWNMVMDPGSSGSLTRSLPHSTDSNTAIPPPPCFSLPMPLMLPLGGGMPFEQPHLQAPPGIVQVQGSDVDVIHIVNDSFDGMVHPLQWCTNHEPHHPASCMYVHVRGEQPPNHFVIVSGERVYLCKLARNEAYRYLSTNPRGSRKWCTAKGTSCYTACCRFAHPLFPGLNPLVATPGPAAPTTPPLTADDVFPSGVVSVGGVDVPYRELIWNAFLADYDKLAPHERTWCRNDEPHDMGSCKRAHRDVYTLVGGGTVDGRTLICNAALLNLRRNTRFRGTWCNSLRPHDPMTCTYLHRKTDADT